MFGNNYPHHLLIEGGTSGGSMVDGTWVPGGTGEDPKYDGGCDAQEPTGKGLKIEVGETKIQSEKAELKILLEDEEKIGGLEIDDTGLLIRGDRKDRITITNIRLIDGMIEAKTIQNNT